MSDSTISEAESVKQSFGGNPVTKRETDHYTEEYVSSFVDKWDELIDWEARAKSEGDFFIKHLQKRGVKRVLDVATGTGFHSVRLLEAGFEVVSADGSAEMLARAFENGRKRGHILRTVQADWRYLNRDIHGEFDAIICLGNSFTHMFDERDRRKALAEFYAMLSHDGILILDQRNYDGMLDEGFSSKHTYYYCGDDVVAEPEYIDDGLARFRYSFPDESVFHLNMFPLRKAYVQQLMKEVGFQQVETYGDFQETYHENDPDFFVHVAEKEYAKLRPTTSNNPGYSDTVNTARDYYNSHDADNFYNTIWGGEDIHVGLYKDSNDTDIFNASRKTVEALAEKIPGLGATTNILDVGAGYGGTARFFARNHGSRVTALNLSEVENERNREMNRERALTDNITVVDGSFEDIPFADDSFDVVLSQDAILHSGDRLKVLREVTRVLAPGGHFIFTDPMQADDADVNELKPILDRIHLDTLGSPGFYKKALQQLHMEFVGFDEMTEQLINHYSAVLAETESREGELEGLVSPEYIERMKKGLRHWIEGGKEGRLAWGILHFKKPE